MFLCQICKYAKFRALVITVNKVTPSLSKYKYSIRIYTLKINIVQINTSSKRTYTRTNTVDRVILSRLYTLYVCVSADCDI